MKKEAARPPTALEVHDLSVAYRRQPVLWDVDFEVPEGRLVGIIGPNGAGKTTLIKAVLGIVPPVSGRVRIYNEPYWRRRALVGYVPQRESVDWDFPIDVLDVVLMGRYGRIGLGRRPRPEDHRAARQALEQVGMLDYIHRQIGQLSGGQQQRVFLARALAQDARIYFMDEPFVGVDAATQRAIVDLMKRMKDEGKTVFVVHHDLSTVREYFDWTILLNMRLIAAGPTDAAFTVDNLQKAYGGRLTALFEGAQSDVTRH